MRSTNMRILCVVISLALLMSLVGCNAGISLASSAPTATTALTETTAAQSQQTQPTQSILTETTPPATTVPTETAPPETEPSTTTPSVTEPVVTQPLETTPPVTTPPVTEPQATEPPVTQPTPTVPAPIYEYGNHYVRILNYTPAPGEPGHIYWNENGAGKYYHQEFTFDVDYKTITYEIWCGWDWLTQRAFRSSQTCIHVTDYEMTPDENYYFDRVTLYEDYSCGYKDHYCKSQSDHKEFMETLANGCHFCAQSDCPSFFARNQYGFNETDKYLCAEYDVYRDGEFYCQDCGRPTHLTDPDRTQHCFSYVRDMNCFYCGVWVKAHACHTCKQEDIDAWNAK